MATEAKLFLSVDGLTGKSLSVSHLNILCIELTSQSLMAVAQSGYPSGRDIALKRKKKGQRKIKGKKGGELISHFGFGIAFELDQDLNSVFFFSPQDRAMRPLLIRPASVKQVLTTLWIKTLSADSVLNCPGL